MTGPGAAEQFQEALDLAAKAYRGRTRPGTPMLLLPHALSVGALLLEVERDYDLAAGAMLRYLYRAPLDPEDRAELRGKFRPKVAWVIEHCGDPGRVLPDAIAECEDGPWECRFILVCDALCTLRTLARGIALQGEGYKAGFPVAWDWGPAALRVASGTLLEARHLPLMGEFREEISRLAIPRAGDAGNS